MKKISETIAQRGLTVDEFRRLYPHSELADCEWAENHGNECMTQDGRHVEITDIDYMKNPNEISGKVDDCDYKWLETGQCIEASTQTNNVKRPEYTDFLCKQID